MRTILNLKYLNAHVTYNHFKMESVQDVFKSKDSKGAFYSVPIHKDHQKYLKFQLLGKIYKFLRMPSGYSETVRMFTKIPKPPFSFFAKTRVTFVDDSYL